MQLFAEGDWSAVLKLFLSMCHQGPCWTSLEVLIQVYKLGLTASLVVRLIGSWLDIASQKVIHDVWNEIA